MGAEWSANTCREQTHFALKVQKDDVGRATEILGDLVSNTNVSPAALEAEREAVRAIHEGSHQEYERTLLENAHFNALRDHMLGQPTRGDVDNLNNISAEDLHAF
jgi:predicted Zn-dependent peptidase